MKRLFLPKLYNHVLSEEPIIRYKTGTRTIFSGASTTYALLLRVKLFAKKNEWC